MTMMTTPAVNAKFRLTMPEPLEREIHANCARVLDSLLLPPAMWAPYPAGAAQLSPQQQARFSAIGIKRGMPDLMIWHGTTYGIELKRRGGKLSKSKLVRTKRGSPRILVGQEDQFPALIATGAWREIAVCHSVDEMLAALDRWQIPRRRAA